jgi:ABC-2 type transport system ATP-binding protein
MRDHLEVRRMIGFVPAGDQTLYLRLSCTENLMFHGRLQGLKGRALHRRISGVLDEVGLAHAADRVGFALSAGMRARLLLARALMNRPRLLLLDEPTAAVDPVGSHELLQLIQRVAQDDGVSVLLSSHRLEEIEALEDQVAVLHEGRIAYHGDLRVFRSRYSKPSILLRFSQTSALADAKERLAAVSLYHVEPSSDDMALVIAGVPSIPDLISSLGDTVRNLKGITEIPMPLRDILRDLVQKSPIEKTQVLGEGRS